MRRARSIRWWLAVFALATVLPLLIIVTWLFVSELRREEMEARAGALRLAKARAAQLGSVFRESASVLERLAQRPAIRSFDGSRCDELFALVELFPQYVDLFLFDRNATIVCSAQPQPEDVDTSIDAREWIAAELRRGTLARGRPALRLVRGRWISAVSREIRGTDGELAGTLVLIHAIDLVGESPARNAVLTIVDQTGRVIARSVEPERWVGHQVRGRGVADVVLRQREGQTEAPGIDGLRRQYGFTMIAETGWHLYAGIPNDEVMRPVRALFARGFVAGGLILFGIALAAMLLSRALSRPINALARAASAVAAGAYGKVEKPHGPLEIVALGESFNVMVERRADAERQMAETERRLKALSDRLLLVQEEERTRIAREIHDDLGQSLTALKMDVLGLLDAPQPSESPQRARVVATLDAIVVAVQRIAAELRPSILDDLGLIAAIESEARLFEERTGIECDLSLPEDLDLEPSRAAAIYRIIQEALTNVARHANASRVELRIRRRGGDLLVDIRDDGRGIAAAELEAASSLGLVGMRERARLVGGTVGIEGIPGRGTIVSVCAPLVPAQGETER
jgi:signal transduction histidine kinase